MNYLGRVYRNILHSYSQLDEQHSELGLHQKHFETNEVGRQRENQ